MARHNDIVTMTEYVKNVLYFATVRPDKDLLSTQDTHYFCIDNELVYENYYADFGPLNLGCVYKYCQMLSEKLKTFLNKRTIVHYTSIDPKKKANAAFLMGCYGVLYLGLSPKDAMKPLVSRGVHYRAFQDATQGESIFTITIMDCLQAIKKAHDLGFFDFKDFNYEDYERLDKITGGDLNWIVPGKFLAFIGPVDYCVVFYHPPEMYLEYFLVNDVNIVVRLNKRMYEANVFTEAGIRHYDLFFADGSCPPRHILFKFLQISEDATGALAVHCKAGLGRTGSLIGSYLIKHYRMTAREAIGWMRICRPGSVIGHQQEWLERVESWLIKQGNLYRKRKYNDTEKFPTHEYGVYSIAEPKSRRPIMLQRTLSPPPPIQRSVRSDISPPMRPQASRVREDVTENDGTATLQPSSSNVSAQMPPSETESHIEYVPKWKKILCCTVSRDTCEECMWVFAVRCVQVTPRKCQCMFLCSFLDMMGESVTQPAFNKNTKENDWRLMMLKSESKEQIPNKGDHGEKAGGSARRTPSREAPVGRPTSRQSSRPESNIFSKSSADPSVRSYRPDRLSSPMRTIRMPYAPPPKSGNQSKNSMKSAGHEKTNPKDDRWNTSISITPHHSYRSPCLDKNMIPKTFTLSRASTNAGAPRRQLGRSPSPPATRVFEQTKATNTPPSSDKALTPLTKDASKIQIREALSRLKVVTSRNGSIGAKSIGAASLGAPRIAPGAMRAPSVRSDERPLATQGDMLNSIKFQRRLRDVYKGDQLTKKFHDKLYQKEIPSTVNAKPSSIRASSPKSRRAVQNVTR